MNTVTIFKQRNFDWSRTWTKIGTHYRFYKRKRFYWYWFPQKCHHFSQLNNGMIVKTHTDYYWLNMILIADHRYTPNFKPIKQ
jgi:hypothetical protein